MNSDKPDKFLKVMKKLIHTWENVPQEIIILNQKITATPDYISISYKEEDSFSASIVNGELTNPPSSIQDAGFSAEVYIGDSVNGYGGANVARSNIPRKTKTLNDIIHEQLDTGLKYALKSYLDHKSLGIIQKLENGFHHLSEEPVETYIEKEKLEKEIDTDFINKIQEASLKISKQKHIIEASSNIVTSKEKRRFCDNEGRMIKDSTYSGDVSFTSEFRHKNGFNLQYGNVLPITKETNIHKLNIEETIEDIISYSRLLRTASVPTSNQYPVILSQNATGTLIHEALAGHLLSGRYIANGASTSFKDKIGKVILPEFITIIDDPQKEGSYSHYVFDDEGIRGKKITLVQNGRLETYLHDRNSAFIFNMHSNGHSRVEWVVGYDQEGNLVPMQSEPRVSNIELISENEVSASQLEETMKKYCLDNNKPFGVYIESGDGEVLPDTGEFILSPSKAFKIFPNGKREAITNFYLIGGTFDLLNKIQVTSNEYERQHGTCGAESGGVPTQSIAPSTFIPDVTLQAVKEDQYTKRLLD